MSGTACKLFPTETLGLDGSRYQLLNHQVKKIDSGDIKLKILGDSEPQTVLE